MRELRAIADAARRVFEQRRLRRDLHALPSSTRRCSRAPATRSGYERPAYRLFDEQGSVLALRADMTVPIARVVATRYPTAEPPLRFWYIGTRLARGAPAARPAARALPGRGRADRRAGAGGDGRGADRDVRRPRRCGAEGLPHRPGRRRAVPGAARRLRRARRTRAARCSRSSSRATSWAWSARWRRSDSARPSRRCSCARRSCAAGRRCSTRPAGLSAPRQRACAASTNCSRPRPPPA